MSGGHAHKHAGLTTMSAGIEHAVNYYDWLYDELEPEMGRSVLEVGPGFGSLAERIVRGGRGYCGVDIDAEVVERLQRKFSGLAGARFEVVDVEDPANQGRLRALGADTVVSTHVLEHIADPLRHLKALYSALPGGRIVTLVPAMPWLYGSWDREAGHYLRYSKSGLRALLEAAGTRDVRIRYFDFSALPGLFLVSTLLRRPLNATTSNGAISVFDRWVIPWARRLDPALRKLAGVNLIASGRIP